MFNDTLLVVAGLAGISGIFTLLINVGKWIGWIKDGQSDKYSMAFNLLLVLAVYFLKLFRPDFDVTIVDTAFGEAATAGVYAFSIIVQIYAGKFTNDLVGGRLPVIGFSYSENKKEEC